MAGSIPVGPLLAALLAPAAGAAIQQSGDKEIGDHGTSFSSSIDLQ